MTPVKRINWPAALIAVIYVVGAIGFLFPSAAGRFAGLTWLTLLLTFVVLVFQHRPFDRGFVLSAFLIAAAGYFLEVIGVHTGMLFGSYRYGPNLGFKILDVPPMIGLNWILLVYLSAFAAGRVTGNPWLAAGIGAALMTALDLLIEPFAIRYGLWSWSGGHVPLQNYGMWFAASFVFHIIFRALNPQWRNRSAGVIGICLVLFFATVVLFGAPA